MGKATDSNVNMSDVGVIMAVITKIPTTACRRQRCMTPAERIPNQASS